MVAESLTRRSVYPEDSLVVIAIAIGIFDRDLRLPYPPQAADRIGLGQGRRSPASQHSMQVVQDSFTTCKKRITAVWDAPDSGGRGTRASIWKGRYLLITFLAIFRDEAKLLNTFPKKVAKLLTIVRTRNDYTIFPTTDVDPRRT